MRFEQDFDGELKKVMGKMEKEFESLQGDSYSSASEEAK
jgi:hypothetical protein